VRLKQFKESDTASYSDSGARARGRYGPGEKTQERLIIAVSEYNKKEVL
jgi:hypothetical protein